MDTENTICEFCGIYKHNRIISTIDECDCREICYSCREKYGYEMVFDVFNCSIEELFDDDYEMNYEELYIMIHGDIYDFGLFFPFDPSSPYFCFTKNENNLNDLLDYVWSRYIFQSHDFYKN